MAAQNPFGHGRTRGYNEIGSASVKSLSPEGILRVLETIRWGTTLSDKVRIAAYYGLRVARGLLRRDHDVATGMYPQFWGRNIDVTTPVGRFLCRANTIDFDIVNPHYEATLLDAYGEWLARCKSQEVVCLDVGAHIGKFSVYAGRVLGGRGQVFAFEPEPLNYGALERNIALNKLTNVRTFKVACGSRDETRLLSLSTTNIGAHTLADRADAEKIPVQVRALDSFLGEKGVTRIHAMKLDVEYMEAEVLRGARVILESSPDVGVFFEETDDSAHASSIVFLRGLGFNVRRLGRNIYAASRAAQF